MSGALLGATLGKFAGGIVVGAGFAVGFLLVAHLFGGLV